MYQLVIPENDSNEGRYVKMLVEVDLTKPLFWGTKIRFEGETRWVMFRYENSFCFAFTTEMLGMRKEVVEKKSQILKILS